MTDSTSRIEQKVTREARKQFPFRSLNDYQGFQAQNYVFTELPILFKARKKVLQIFRINNKSSECRKRKREAALVDISSDEENFLSPKPSTADAICQTADPGEDQCVLAMTAPTTSISYATCNNMPSKDKRSTRSSILKSTGPVNKLLQIAWVKNEPLATSLPARKAKEIIISSKSK